MSEEHTESHCIDELLQLIRDDGIPEQAKDGAFLNGISDQIQLLIEVLLSRTFNGTSRLTRTDGGLDAQRWMRCDADTQAPPRICIQFPLNGDIRLTLFMRGAHFNIESLIIGAQGQQRTVTYWGCPADSFTSWSFAFHPDLPLMSHSHLAHLPEQDWVH